mmetsp:Transcript_20570/g.37120  ORF Transcript_20570/g.37120 Transcript_20570/m.37120 type:complete len:622 (+) Transcript_20570:246-2111(+)
MRFDIAFFLCCCRSFLSSNGRDDGESFYELLGVPPKATPDELKRAYKRQSLLMHPDKLAQKGQSVPPADRDRFTRMRHAYEVLSDPRRRETYDAIGERGMKWVEEPLSVDPQELAHNFATSSILDRSKIFAIFLGIYIAVFLLPIFVCLMADGTLGEKVKWVAVLTPLWVWDVCILFYHSRVILMGPIKRPDHIPEEEWVDPLPMWKRVMAMVRFACLVLFQVLLALRLDGYIAALWSIIFIPMYLWDAIALRRKITLTKIIIVTHEELELAIGKKMGDCTAAEREHIHSRYIVVPTKSGSIYDSACRLRDEARMDIIRILARFTFTLLLVLNLDLGEEWSWWLVFLPIFAMTGCIVGSAFGSFAKTQSEAVKKDPSLFGLDPSAAGNDGEQGAYAKMDENKQGEEPTPLRDEEKDELKAKVAQSAYRAVGTCFSQCFFIIIMCVLIGKIEGAGYSSLVIISPFLAAGGIILCCLACTIFCISEVDENAGMAEFDTAVNQAAAANSGSASGYGATENARADDSNYTPPSQADQQSEISCVGTSESDVVTTATVSSSSKSKPPPSSVWDPELGEVWQNTTIDEGDGTETKEEETKTVPDLQPTIIEGNPSMSSVTSSQCDLD